MGIVRTLGVAMVIWLAGCGGRALVTSGNGSTQGSKNVCASSESSDGPFLRKSFLIDNPATADAPQWSLQVHLVSAIPAFGMPGPDWTGAGNFVITSDKLQLIAPMLGTTTEVLDSWPIDNVDLDANCSPNRTQEWQARAWVKWSFSKTDVSDLFALDLRDQPSPVFQCIETSRP